MDALLQSDDIVYHLHQLSSKAINRAPELGGIFLLGVGVILLLSSLSHTPVFALPDTASPTYSVSDFAAPVDEPIGKSSHFHDALSIFVAGSRRGVFLLLLASCSLASGYFIIRRYVSTKPNIFIWLVIAEVLAESSILGWLLVTSGLTLPLPNSRWGILSAMWLENFLGVLGAILLPVIVLCISFHLKRNLRK
ncbi:MAG: hypothetical protein AB8G77_13305 [Rhodothermales bacterium]